MDFYQLIELQVHLEVTAGLKLANLNSSLSHTSRLAPFAAVVIKEPKHV